MSTAEATRMTVEEFLALPDDGVERMLIDGVVMELGMSVRNWQHSTISVNVSSLLHLWLKQRPRPRGRVSGGDAGFRLVSGSLVGVDVAYASPELAAATTESDSYFDGPPTLAVEILSPSDQQRNIIKKIAAYLEAGVEHVWIIEPVFRTVTVYQPNGPPRQFNVEDEITAEPHLPGFRVAVAAIFED